MRRIGAEGRLQLRSHSYTPGIHFFRSIFLPLTLTLRLSCCSCMTACGITVPRVVLSTESSCIANTSPNRLNPTPWAIYLRFRKLRVRFHTCCPCSEVSGTTFTDMYLNIQPVVRARILISPRSFSQPYTTVLSIMDAGPSKKRTRSNAGVEDAPPATGLDKVQAATHDKDYWFEDGNLILVSQGVAFKVYKGLLAEHSTVFRSMFHVARGTPETEELVDGCPVVTLYDSPSDLRELFQLVYPLNANIKLGTGHKVDIAFISAIIRLDHKYELKALYDQAMSYLTTYYTAHFDAWVDGRNATQWQPDPIHAIGAINLARLTNTTSILPFAFYICATLGPDLARGFIRADGSIERLTPEDMRLCLEMKARLAAENAHTAFLLFRPAPQHCSSSSGSLHCADLWRKILEHAGLSKAPHPVASERALDSWLGNADSLPTPASASASTYMPAQAQPFGPGVSFSMYMSSYSPPRSLCKGCRSHLEVRDRELRRQIWRRLPEFVGLTIENWDT